MARLPWRPQGGEDMNLQLSVMVLVATRGQHTLFCLEIILGGGGLELRPKDSFCPRLCLYVLGSCDWAGSASAAHGHHWRGEPTQQAPREDRTRSGKRLCLTTPLPSTELGAPSYLSFKLISILPEYSPREGGALQSPFSHSLTSRQTQPKPFQSDRSSFQFHVRAPVVFQDSLP